MSSYQCEIAFASGPQRSQKEIVKCTWSVSVIKDSHDSLCINTVDLLVSKESLVIGTRFLKLTPESLEKPRTSTKVILNKDLAISKFLINVIEVCKYGSEIGIKLVLPVSNGYVSRSDIIEYRMQGCEFVQTASGFVTPRQHVKPPDLQHEDDKARQLHEILVAAVGGVVAKPVQGAPLSSTMLLLESEIHNRLAFRWLLPNPIPYRRLALVRARQDPLSLEGIKALGIGLVVLDAPGNWLEDSRGPYSHLREAFIPFDLNPDQSFSQRLFEAVQDLNLDGITTREDRLLSKVAVVAQNLGLPTAPASAYVKATDKYSTRMLEVDDEPAICVSSVEELQDKLQSQEEPLKLQYPSVVKPCSGSGSNCVAKVSNETELFEAVSKARSRIIGYEGDVPIIAQIMIEPYIEGPEVDANFILWNGEILFFEVSDDFPSSADKNNATLKDDFQETMFVYPSQLPKVELELLRSSLYASVLRMGFRSGIFHVEARVRNSSMHYVDSDGILELEPRSTTLAPKLSVFLIEINARPPAYHGCMTIASTYGIDYFAQHVLHALNDETRFRALACPFAGGPQYTSALILIMPEKGGILTSPDPAGELQQRRPDLMDKVILYREWFKKGDVVPAPEVTTMAFLTCLAVFLRDGRKALLRLADTMRKEWRHTIE